MPTPISKTAKSLISIRQQRSHFGQPVPIEECAQILDIATSITAIPCICRMHEPGKRAEEVCMLVTTQPVESLITQGFSGYADGPRLDDFNRMTKQDAMGLLRTCEESGLMHSIWTFKTPFAAAICNCDLASGCMAMKLTAGYGLKMMWRGESVAVLDDEACSGCASCVGLCPFGAIDESSRRVAVRTERCWGCGVCRAACPSDALSLRDRRLVPDAAGIW
jgi:Pyruvate/2-oxoacid:ferredoxin oxidoreductase delta subunit